MVRLACRKFRMWGRRLWRALGSFPTKRTATLISVLLNILQIAEIALKLGGSS
jgi:hypothetical protein